MKTNPHKQKQHNTAFNDMFADYDKARPWRNSCETCNNPESYCRLKSLTGESLELCFSCYQEQIKPENLLRFIKGTLDKAIKEA